MKMPPIHRRRASTVSKVSNSLKRAWGSFLILALALHTGTTLPQTATDKTAPQIKCCRLAITLFFEEPVIFFARQKNVVFLFAFPDSVQWNISVTSVFFPPLIHSNVAIHGTLNATFQAEGLMKQSVTIELPLNPSALFTDSRQFQSIRQMPSFSRHNYRVWPNFKRLAGKV